MPSACAAGRCCTVRTAPSAGCAGSYWLQASAAYGCRRRRQHPWRQPGKNFCCPAQCNHLEISYLLCERMLLGVRFVVVQLMNRHLCSFASVCFCRSASPALAGMYLPEMQALLLNGQLEAVPTAEADLLAVPSLPSFASHPAGTSQHPEHQRVVSESLARTDNDNVKQSLWVPCHVCRHDAACGARR